jgi:hypothetical protein
LISRETITDLADKLIVLTGVTVPSDSTAKLSGKIITGTSTI